MPNVPRGSTPAERILFRREVDNETGCWNWTGTVTHNGYGNIGLAGRTQRAHRVSYEAFVGPIPEGLTLDHLCSNRRCVNPDHLEPVTRGENTRRGKLILGGRPNSPTTCHRGHDWSQPGMILIHHVRGREVRRCRPCRNESKRRYRERAKLQDQS